MQSHKFKYRGRTCWSGLLMLPGTWLVVFAARAYCRFMHNLLSVNTSSSYKMLSSQLSSQSVLLHRVSSAQTQDLAFASAIKQGAAFTVFEWSLGYFSYLHTTQLWRNIITQCRLQFHSTGENGQRKLLIGASTTITNTEFRRTGPSSKHII